MTGRERVEIKGNCPMCGEVELTPSDIRLVVCSIRAWSYYEFTCTGCNDLINKPAPPQVISLLVSGYVIVEPWPIPDEVVELHEGAPISYDDILDFAKAVAATDFLTAAIATHSLPQSKSRLPKE